jgi:hypothetical protein
LGRGGALEGWNVGRLERGPIGIGLKVFGVGLSRTGTTSLTRALQVLGWRAVHYPAPQGPAAVLAAAERWDALTDTPVVVVYQELAQRYPEARFIMTVRRMDDWLASCERFFARVGEARGAKLAVRMAVYGAPGFERDAFEAAYRRHVRGVRRFFAGEPERLLVMDIAGGQGWERLCPFLGVGVPPGGGFPRENAG